MGDEKSSSAGMNGWWSTLGWAAFLGCSWTWCIGMFLPVLLLRDFGFWGWVVFAVPNVIGAAAMGWVLRDAAASRRIIERHAAACAAFSVVTILFHVLFVGWIVRGLVGTNLAVGAAAAATLVFAIVLSINKGAARITAGLLWLASAAIFLALAMTRTDRPTNLYGPTTFNLAWIAPICFFGFAFCPYLDLTFHEARQAAERRGAAAFTIGFGLLFAVMIVFTLWYAPYLLQGSVPGGVAEALAAHMIAQAAFTVAAHGLAMWRSIRLQPLSLSSPRAVEARADGRFFRLLEQPSAGCAIGLAGGLLILAAARFGPSVYHGLSAAEMGYRLFMAFYGLVFPAYVWICMIPNRWEAKARFVAFTIAVLFAAPLFWLGFIERHYGWLGPGFLIVLLARWIPVAQRTPVR